jgi:transglutaminase-like putative cysteine protease
MISTILDLTVRVGCHLTYEAAVPTPVVFILRPRLDDNHLVTAEKRSFEPGLPSYEFQDSHGNIACRSMLSKGRSDIRLDALIAVSSKPETQASGALPIPVHDLPTDLLRYTLPSRYCDSDKLLSFAWTHFGHISNGHERVQAICDWVHKNIEYRYGSGRSDLSASDVIERRYGVCRDFAHVVVALCRTFNLPARYVTGHIPEIGSIVSSTPEDFHAYCEVYLGHQWFTLDARFNVPRIGRIKLSHGMDAVDGAFATVYGETNLVYFEVWTYQVDPKEITLNDPIDLSKRLDGTLQVRLS